MRKKITLIALFVSCACSVFALTNKNEDCLNFGNNGTQLEQKGNDGTYAWQRTPHYRGIVENTFTLGVGEHGLNRDMVSMSNGCQINSNIYLGVGCGINYWTDDKVASFPIFAHFRSEWHNENGRNVSPFIDLRGGYNTLYFTGGYVAPSVGCHWYFGHKKAGLGIRVGYSLHTTTSNVEKYGNHASYFVNNDSKKKAVLHGAELGVSVDF